MLSGTKALRVYLRNIKDSSAAPTNTSRFSKTNLTIALDASTGPEQTFAVPKYASTALHVALHAKCSSWDLGRTQRCL